MTLAEVIAELEGAEEGSRLLDIAIDKLIRPGEYVSTERTEDPPDLPADWGQDPMSLAMHGAPSYSTSLDAALTLVPEGWGASIVLEASRHGSARCWDWVGDGPLPSRAKIHEAATPALALCIAALRARASIASGEKDNG